MQYFFDLIGGARQLTLYALLLPIPIVIVVFAAEFRAAQRRSPGVDAVQRMLFTVDALSTAVGKTFGWCIVILTFSTSYEVFARYVFGAPTEWAFDASYILYGTLFMMAGAYALSRNAHVRGDFIYRAWSNRRQAAMDLVLYILFFFPAMLAFIYAGYKFAQLSTLMNEHSAASPNGPVVWPFKWLIPVTGVLMVLQGIVEVIRCIICLRTGEWPQRLHDVEELEKIVLSEAEQQKEAAFRSESAGVRRGDI
jgi:TRAP-type mannitol/chloroaromatic compound transport system permease small subunit